VHSAYFTAWGQSALVGVAKASVEAALGHLSQTEAMVTVGTKPELDLAQVKADLASARLDLVKAENAALLAKAQLVRVLGAPLNEAFEVADAELPSVPGEDGAVEPLADQATSARPELRALSAQSRMLIEQGDAVWAGYFPSLSLGSGFNLLGANLDAMTWNWSAQLTLSWSIWKGGATSAALRENEAQQEAALAQLEEQRLAVRAEVREAQLAVRAAKAAAIATLELDGAAAERLRLAEGRYAAGAGTIIELEDAQLAATAAKAQVVQVRVQLAVARAQLIHALGE
jgi:outer membrane protein